MARGRDTTTDTDTATDIVTGNSEDKPKRVRRPTPEGELVDVNELEAYGARTRGGVWFERAKWFRENPGQVKVYKGVPPTIATHLKRNHGLQAATRNNRDGGKTADLLVGYFPEGYELPGVFQGGRTKKEAQ